LGGNKTAIWLTNADQKVTFDMKIPTNKGLLFAMYFKRESEIAATATDKPKPKTNVNWRSTQQTRAQ
jgi:hypothetical protein